MDDIKIFTKNEKELESIIRRNAIWDWKMRQTED